MTRRSGAKVFRSAARVNGLRVSAPRLRSIAFTTLLRSRSKHLPSVPKDRSRGIRRTLVANARHGWGGLRNGRWKAAARGLQ
jgi:hypothetical protein